MNKLYFGDNLGVMREHLADESVDLIYLDPPFNSKRDYNLLFKTPKGHESDAQITAFEDTWHWGPQAEHEFAEILHQANTDVAGIIQALRSFLGQNDMMAYLVMMANRLLEMHRVLKSTGSIYLHCDPTASHYLKIVLDGVFSPENFHNEIIWRRSGAHNSARRYGPIHDTIFFYSKTKKYTWNTIYRPYLVGHVESYFKKHDERGRYWSNALTGAGTRNGESGQPWHGFDPTMKGRHWAIPSALTDELGIDESLSVQEKLDALLAENCINLPEGDGLPEYRQYLHLSKGTKLQDIWAYQPHTKGTVYGHPDECIDEDVRWIGKRGDRERLGYPTQKPLSLLERMLSASSNEGDVVLDPFCGCGTAVHAAQKLKRQWIGIDITHLAISLIEKRLRDAFPGVVYEVEGTPKDLAGAQDLATRSKYQFQWWACSLVHAQPFQGKKKGADSGIDGLIFFQDDAGAAKKIIVSVKGGENVSVAMVRDLAHVRTREKAELAFFVTLAKPTKPMLNEALKEGLYKSPANGVEYARVQILTVEELLEHGAQQYRPPDLAQGGHTFKKAILDQGTSKQEKLF
jgi:site-specific DNA-methyltransferase (adenine-specific)